MDRKPIRLLLTGTPVDCSPVGPCTRHLPVLENAVLQLLAPVSGMTVLDVTLGLGGHAERFLREGAARCSGLDADQENLHETMKRLAPFGNAVEVMHANFRDLPTLELPKVNIVFADLGLSSPHIDDPGRGFSFRTDGPLDLRFDRTTGITGAELLATMSEEDIATMLRDLGELRQTKHLAEVIKRHQPKTTFALRACAEEVYRWRAPRMLPQLFQALRMHVNDELGALQNLLAHGPSFLLPRGTMAVISYHSLEDRLVKHVFRSLCTPMRDDLTGKVCTNALFELLTRHAICPTDQDIAENPRARSAKLRAIRLCC